MAQDRSSHKPRKGTKGRKSNGTNPTRSNGPRPRRKPRKG